MDNSYAALGPSYPPLWAACQPGVLAPGAPQRNLDAEIDDAVALLLAHRDRYEALERTAAVPWWFVAVLHLMESSCDLRCHLHNGDPLTARTVNVPAGRPVAGSPPFAWAASATDALEMKGWLRDLVARLPPDGRPDWTLARTLWRLEAWNGWG